MMAPVRDSGNSGPVSAKTNGGRVGSGHTYDIQQDPDSTGPLPTTELLIEQQLQTRDAAARTEVPSHYTAANDAILPEPANAPGWETLSVEGRIGSESHSGATEFLSWGSRSDVGLVRSHNEDSMLVSHPLFCVCDGMGGHAAGEVASLVAKETIAANAPDIADDILLGVAVEKANTAVLNAVLTGQGKPGMGCTATAVLIDKGKMAVAHVGDSRVYVLHAGMLVRLTHDHSFVEELVDAGEITIGEARLHPGRSIITRALGSDPNMYADHFTVDVETGDRIIVCSDGLSSMLPDSHIEEVATSCVTPQGAVDNLVADALAAGGYDNVSAIVIDVLDDGTVLKHRKKALHAAYLWAGVALALVLLVIGGGFFFVSRTYYLGVNGDTVAIYRGVRAEFLGNSLSGLSEETDVLLEDLPEATQHQLEEGIYVDSLAEARSTVHAYEEQIAHEKESTSETAENAAGVSSSADSSLEESSSDASSGEESSSETTSSSGAPASEAGE